MTYLAKPAHTAPADFRALIKSLKFDKGWKPEFPTLHNTGVPSLKQWLAMGATPQERWGANLNAYYKGMGWHAGPHLVCCPDYIWVLCDPEQNGVSVSCWNSVTFGIEMVGNYEVGGDDFSSGDGEKVRDNAVFALATLAEKFGWDIAKVLHFHRECARDHHACPGSKVAKAEIVQRVNAQLEVWNALLALPEKSPSPGDDPGVASKPPDEGFAPHGAPAPKPSPQPSPARGEGGANRAFDLSTIAGVQQALVALGYRIDIDGELGPDTRWAVRSFQIAAGIVADGVAGAVTQAAIRKELFGNRR